MEAMRHAAGFMDSVLRGVGQVMFQDNPWTGLLFLIGIFFNQWVWGLFALLGTACATAAARLWGAPEHDIRHGLYGFNGTLTALALGLYLRPGAAVLAYILLGSVVSSVFMAAIARASGGRALTAPFVLTTWVFVGGIGLFSHVHSAAALAPPHLGAGGGAATAVLGLAGTGAGVLNGVAQVMLQQNPWTGLIFLVALVVNSRRACVAAALGSAIALGAGWALGAAPEALRAGLFGFNAVLTAIAVGSLYFLLRRATLLLTLLAVFVSTLLYATMVVAFSPLGLPVVTAPFVLTTWVCLLAQGPWSRLRAPEAHPTAVAPGV